MMNKKHQLDEQKYTYFGEGNKKFIDRKLQMNKVQKSKLRK